MLQNEACTKKFMTLVFVISKSENQLTILFKHHLIKLVHGYYGDFPGGTSGKEPTCQADDVRDSDSIPGLGRSPGGRPGNSTPVFLPGKGIGRSTIHEDANSHTRLSTHTYIHTMEYSTIIIDDNIHPLGEDVYLLFLRKKGTKIQNNL